MTAGGWLEQERRAERFQVRDRARRKRASGLAETYNRWLVLWWVSGNPGERCTKARGQLEAARTRLVEATR